MEYKLVIEQSPDPVSGDDMTLELDELRTNLEKKICRIFKEIEEEHKAHNHRLTCEDYKGTLIGGINITTVTTDKGVYITLSQAVIIPTRACNILKLMERTLPRENACFEF